jgi:transcriptional regulator with XRE-family HTH domain
MAELQEAEIVERIRQARKEAGLTQPEMADLLDVSMRAYQNYEADRVPYKLMGKISDITGKSLRWLLHGEEEPGLSPELMHHLSLMEARILEELRAGRQSALPPEEALEAELAEAVEQERTRAGGSEGEALGDERADPAS